MTTEEFSEAFAALIIDLHDGTITDAEFSDQAIALLTEANVGGDISNANLAARISELVSRWNIRESQYSDWQGGSINGGPEGDGRYPLTDSAGNEYLVPSPARIAYDASGLLILGTLDDPGDLPPTGDKQGSGYLIDGNFWTWIGDEWINVGPVQGPAGADPQMRVNGGFIQFKTTNDSVWTNLIPTADLVGPAGPPIELRTSGGYIQWRVVGTTPWNNLIPLADLKGEKGDPFEIDAREPFANRSAYDAEPEGFAFLATDQGLIYFRESATPGVWSDGSPFKGDQGDSAYQVAVNNGFVGTEDQWLATLVGPPADPAAIEAMRQDALRGLFRISRFPDLTGSSFITLYDGRVDNFMDTVGVDLAESTGVTAHVDYLTNTPDATPIPNMTSNTAPAGYVASVSSIQSGQAWHVFDGSSSTYWAGANDQMPAWVKIQLPGALFITEYTIAGFVNSGANTPRGWILQGSNNNVDWTNLDTRTGKTWPSDKATESFVVATPGSYLYYRLYINDAYTSTPGFAFGGLWSLTLTPSDDPQAMEVVSTPQAAAAQADFASINILCRRLDANPLVPNVDIQAFVARDAGTTWVAADLETQEEDDGWTMLGAINVDLSSTPAGLLMRYRLLVTDDVEIQIDGVALNWTLAPLNPISSPVPGITILDVLVDDADLPETGVEPGDAYLVDNTGGQFLWVRLQSGEWRNLGEFPMPGPEGPAGPGVPTTRQIVGGGLVTGGGDLTADRTLTVTAANAGQIRAGSSTTTVVRPNELRTSAAFIALTDAATVAWNTQTGYNAAVILGGNRLIGAPTGLYDGVVYSLKLVQDATGSRTVTWDAIWDWGDAGAPTLSTGANKIDRVYAQYDSTAGKLVATFKKAAP